MRSYEAARTLHGILGFLAGCVLIVGLVAAFAAAVAANEMSGPFGGPPSAMAVFLAASPGLAMAFLGFLGLATVQNGRATVDTAEYTQQMLQLARDQLDVSRQTLKRTGEPPRSFASAQPEEAATRSTDRLQPPFEPVAESLPAPGKPPRISIYRNHRIEFTDGHFQFNGRTFSSLAEAERYIDEAMVETKSAALEPPPASLEFKSSTLRR